MQTLPKNQFLVESKRIKIRAIDKTDLEDLYEVYSDPLAMRWVDDGQPITYPDCERWIEITLNNYKTRGYGLSAVTLLENTETIGFCGLVHPNGQEKAEIKYALKKAYWGNGYATETVEAMLRYGLNQHGLTTIIATVDPENLASQAVLRKAGLAFESEIEDEHGNRTYVFVWNSKHPSREPR